METRFKSVEEQLDRAERHVRVQRGILLVSMVGALVLLATAPGIGGSTLKPITQLIAGTGLAGGGTGPAVTLGVAPGGPPPVWHRDAAQPSSATLGGSRTSVTWSWRKGFSPRNLDVNIVQSGMGSAGCMRGSRVGADTTRRADRVHGSALLFGVRNAD
jgi:hypothetical protein